MQLLRNTLSSLLTLVFACGMSLAHGKTQDRFERNDARLTLTKPLLDTRIHIVLLGFDGSTPGSLTISENLMRAYLDSLRFPQAFQTVGTAHGILQRARKPLLGRGPADREDHQSLLLPFRWSLSFSVATGSAALLARINHALPSAISDSAQNTSRFAVVPYQAVDALLAEDQDNLSSPAAASASAVVYVFNPAPQRLAYAYAATTHTQGSELGSACPSAWFEGPSGTARIWADVQAGVFLGRQHPAAFECQSLSATCHRHAKVVVGMLRLWLHQGGDSPDECAGPVRFGSSIPGDGQQQAFFDMLQRALRSAKPSPHLAAAHIANFIVSTALQRIQPAMWQLLPLGRPERILINVRRPMSVDAEVSKCSLLQLLATTLLDLE
jgi:hypothetical protein